MTNTNKKATDFKVNQLVKYIPNHADGDGNHPDCEVGRVSSITDSFVFVKFMGYENGQACKPENLI